MLLILANDQFVIVYSSLCLFFIWHHLASFVWGFFFGLLGWFFSNLVSINCVGVFSVSCSASVVVLLEHKFTDLKYCMPTQHPQLLAMASLCKPFASINIQLIWLEAVCKFCKRFQKPSNTVFLW